MHKYFLIYTACLNVETEVQCTAVPSTLTLWMETKWSSPLLIRNLRWHADVTGIYKRKNIQIILKCNSPTFTIWTEYLYFYTMINSKFQQLPPPLEESMGIWLSSIQEGGPFKPYLGGVGNFNWKCKSLHQNKHMVLNARHILDLNHQWSNFLNSRYLPWSHLSASGPLNVHTLPQITTTHY